MMLTTAYLHGRTIPRTRLHIGIMLTVLPANRAYMGDTTMSDHCDSCANCAPKPEPVKPLHYDGEPCELPVFVGDRERAEGLTFVYTGKQGSPEGNWFVSQYINKIMFGNVHAKDGEFRWLLRPICPYEVRQGDMPYPEKPTS